MAAAAVCPVVGTTNDVLPPSHPDVDLAKPGQTCPVVGAKTEHHANLHKHPKVPGADSNNAEQCPALQKIVSNDKEKAMDEGICPVVGTATSVLPPDHPSLSGKADDAECPVVKAKVGDHKNQIHSHPSVANAAADAVCPVAGVKAK
jgi:hypothetical protein